MFTVLVVSAALLYSIGGYFMKLSRGLTEVTPTTMVFVCFGVGAALQTLSMRGESMTVTYVIVLGIEAVTAYLLGTLVLQEPTSLSKVTGIVLIVAGIVLLKLKA
jgi:small multidrug resistance pump/quaternary ammonium compound-resistance protein SugE